MVSLNRWLESWQGHDYPVSLTLETEYKSLTEAYKEPHRHYHGVQHLDECFQQLDSVKREVKHPDEVQLALWYHDSVYDTRRSDNELLSAQWAARSLEKQGAPQEKVRRITEMILATAGHSSASTKDAQIMLDIDMAILGAGPERFREYERQIRQEFVWVPESVYRSKRRAVLEGFLARDRIYGSESFRNRLEEQARNNIGMLCKELYD